MQRYADNVPPVVLPDTPEGHEDAREYHDENLYVRFCEDYKPPKHPVDSRVRNVCGERTWAGNRFHNLCYACPAGYLFWASDDPMTEDGITPGFVSGL